MTSDFTNPVCATDQASVLQSVVNVLQATITAFDTEQTCFLSDVPWPGLETNDNLFCTVCPANGSFDGELVVGGGPVGIEEHSVVQVTVWSRLSTDRYERAKYALLDANRGLLPLKKAILKSLAGQQLYADYPTNSVPLLTTYLTPTRSMHVPIRESQDDYASFSLAFNAPFYWDLS
jgi:hypothetical protein